MEEGRAIWPSQISFYFWKENTGKAPLSSYRAFSQGDMEGWMREDLWRALPASFFEDPICSLQKMDLKIIKES